MVRNRKDGMSQRANKDLEQPEENMNLGEKDKLLALTPEDEIELNQLHGPIVTNPSRDRNGWGRHNEQQKSYETEIECIGEEEDQFLNGEKLYGPKDTVHKIGHLSVPDQIIDLMEDEKGDAIKLMSQIFGMLGFHDSDFSLPVAGDIHTLYRRAILGALLHPYLSQVHTAKDSVGLNLLSGSFVQTHGKFSSHQNPGVSDRSQIEDIPQQKMRDKQTQLGSVDVVKNYSEERSLPAIKNSSFFESGVSKSNSLYSAENSEFNTNHDRGRGDDREAYGMVVLYQYTCHRLQLTRNRFCQSQEILEISHLVYGSEINKNSADSRGLAIRSYDGDLITDKTRHVWTDSGGGAIYDRSGTELMMRKDEEPEDLGSSAINKNFPTFSGLKRKDSLDFFLPGDKRHEDHPKENSPHAEVDPMLKLDAALLGLWPDTSPGSKRSQKKQAGEDSLDQQDIFSSLSESSILSLASSDADWRSDFRSSTASQCSSHYDIKDFEDSSTEEGQADDIEQLSAEVAAVSQSESNGQNKDRETSENDSHCRVASAGETRSHSEAIQREITADTALETEELPVERVKANPSTDEEVPCSSHDPDNSVTATATDDSSSNVEHLTDNVQTNSSGAAAASHVVVHQSVPDRPPSLPLSEGSSAEGTPYLFFCQPIQISSPDSGLDHSAFPDIFKEPYHWTNLSSPPEQDRAVYRGDNPLMTQETESSLGACGGHASVVAQEEGCYFSHSGDDWGLSVAEESVFLFTPSPHHQEPFPQQSESHSLAHLRLSEPQEPSSAHNTVQVASNLASSHSQPASYSHHTPLQTDSPFPSHSTPVPSAPVTVHATGPVPPWAATSVRVDLTLATNPEYVEMRQRRTTYSEDWPRGGGIDASNMALAGFFNRGHGHGVRCFYCGLELFHLTSAHNIWDEHVRHNPQCPYLAAIMGRIFIQETLRRLRDHNDDDDKRSDGESSK